MKKFLIPLLIATGLLAGCAALTPVTQTTTINGQPVQKTLIRVNQPFTFDPALYSATWLAGDYPSKFVDKDGVFFPSPDQILIKNVFGGGTAKGGLFVSKDSWTKIQAYIDDGIIYKFEIPVQIDITIVKP